MVQQMAYLSGGDKLFGEDDRWEEEGANAWGKRVILAKFNLSAVCISATVAILLPRGRACCARRYLLRRPRFGVSEPHKRGLGAPETCRKRGGTGASMSVC